MNDAVYHRLALLVVIILALVVLPGAAPERFLHPHNELPATTALAVLVLLLVGVLVALWKLEDVKRK